MASFGKSLVLALFLCLSGCSFFKRQDRTGEWRYYAADAGSTKFSPLKLITKENVKKLKVAWTWDSIDGPLIASRHLDTLFYEATPLMVDGLIYTSTSLNQVAAIDPKSGHTVWTYDPKTYDNGSPPNGGFVHRGVAYWAEGSMARIFIGTNDGYLISLDAKTGKPDGEFGTAGRVDLTKQLYRAVERQQYSVTSPPLVCNGTLIVGSSINDQALHRSMPPGDVRGYDPLTGKLKWTFHTVPQAGEFGVETWAKESWKYEGNTNVWAPMSADPALNSVYLPVSAPTNNYYGGERPGDGLFGDSLVSLNCETGRRNWHFQLVHHGIWDYDPPAAPVLMDIEHENKRIKAVVEVTKQSFAYVFDRETGQPIWPITEKPTPPSHTPGEQASPTQPIPSLPLPFDRQGITVNDLIDFTPQLRREAEAILKKYEHGPLFTPASTKSVLSLPGWAGGASWAGAAYSPTTGKLYVPSVTSPSVLTLKALGNNSYFAFDTDPRASGRLMGPQGLPLLKPPYGRITAIDMASGQHAWMRPMGRGPRDNPALKGVRLPEGDLGWERRTHLLVTPELLFAAQAGTFEPLGSSAPRHNDLIVRLADGDPALWAFDPETGEKIAKIKLPSNAWGAPMTYEYDGRQYIVLPFGGANLKSGLIALTLGEP